MNKEVRGCTSSSKQQQAPTEITKTKEEICLEQVKRKLKTAALEWGDFVLQKQLKYLIYVDRSLRGDTKKYKLIDELNFKNFVRLKIETTSKFFISITKIIKSVLFILNVLMPTIYYHIHLFRISNINQTWISTCKDK